MTENSKYLSVLFRFLWLLIVVFIIIFIQKMSDLESNKNITFKVFTKSLPDSSNIYISGNHPKLGTWNPAIIPLTFKSDSSRQILLSFPLKTKLEYKFTRGSWETEALDNYGNVRSNSVLMIERDTTIIFYIDKWKDGDMKEQESKITGLFDYHQEMEFPGIKSRDIIVWLPPGYKIETEKRYPVVYMHDGQNLFDPSTSFLGIDWQADETVSRMIKKGDIDPLIIVGIYNTIDRTEEYAPTTLGQIYMKFLVNKLKPFIDQNYRTIPDRDNTTTGGSSMGGLISFMLAWEYSNIFSKAICMSPAFKIEEIDYVIKVKNYLKAKKDIKIYIDNGGIDLEKRLQPGIDEMLIILEEKGFSFNEDLVWYKDNSAPHNESAWASRFWRPLKFFFKKSD